MVNPWYLLSFLLFLFLCFQFGVLETATIGNVTNIETAESNSLAHVGLVLDLNSRVGAMANVCASMALSDFYAIHSNYKTRLLLHTRDSDDVVGAASAVVDLLKNVEVQAIIVGPQRSTEARFVIELGRKVHIPIISFSATSPSLSPSQIPYFIRTAQNDSSQVKAITAIVQGFGWHEVVFLYEDTEYGNGLMPYLIDAFEEVDIRVTYMTVIPTSATDSQIVKKLNKLMTMQTRVFLVHMTTSLGSRLFALANKAGMMSEGYAWLITDGLSNLLNAMDHVVIDSMEGVLGIRPNVPKPKELENFKMRWRRKFPFMNQNSTSTELKIFGLWAYDTIWALAMAVERIGSVSSSFLKVNNSKSTATDLSDIGISEMGPRLLNEILNTRFKGLSGEFHLVSGQLQPSAFEIFNVIGRGERIIGYWNPDKGISRELGSTSELTYPITSMDELKKIIWPGDSMTKPIGWVIPIIKKNLQIGVPLKNGFNEFVRIGNNETNVTGFCVDVFLAVLNTLPFKLNYTFIPFMTKNRESNGTYNELLYQIYNKKLDAVVGDTTIVGNRWFVDFTLPFSESGVSMVVPVKHERSKNIWIFIKPFSWDLWLTIVAASIITGIVVCILERRANPRLRDAPQKQIDMILWLPFSALYFAQRDMVVDKRSRFVLIVWFMLMLILMQSYTASLSSILTVQGLKPIVYDEKQQYYIGYQKYSFVKELLIRRLKFPESKLKPYSSAEEYDEALSKGPHNGGVSAIIDETPYIKLFLAKYCSKYMMVGTTYKTDGFGFAFPIGSPLVSYVSKAILNVTQGDSMDAIEQKYFGGHGNSCQDQASTATSDSYSLKAYSFGGLLIVTFGGLFVITGALTLFQVVSESAQWKRLVVVIIGKHFNQNEVRVDPNVEMNDIGNSPQIDDSIMDPSRISNHSDMIEEEEEEEEEE